MEDVTRGRLSITSYQGPLRPGRDDIVVRRKGGAVTLAVRRVPFLELRVG